MARKRKVGRPKGSKNKRSSKRRKMGKRKSKATAAQLRALKKARAALKKSRSGKGRKKIGRRKKATAKQLAALRLARAARELKNMPKTLRMSRNDAMAETVRAGSMPSILLNVRRRPAPTLVSNY